MIVKWGILGTGKIASKFAKEFEFVSNSEVYGIASRSLDKAKRFAKEHNIPTYFGSYQTLLNDPNIDAVYIATPHSLHCENTLDALQRNKAVLCEKPFAMNLEELLLMINTAKTKELLLMEGLWTAFLPHYQFVVDQIKTKTLGKLKSLTADFGFPVKVNTESRLYKKSLGGGSLLDIGVYPVFLALSSLGKPDFINASADFFENGVDKSCEITFSYDDGRTASLYSTFTKNTATEALLDFENGSIKLNGRFHEPTSVEIFDGTKRETIEFSTQGLGYSYEIEHFNGLLRDKKIESPIMNYERSIQLISVLDRIREKIGLIYN